MKDPVPWLPKQTIARAAEDLLTAAESDGITIAIPIPIEEIIEFHCGLGLGFGDLSGHPGGEVLAATYMERREIIVSPTFNPDLNPFALSRFRFTVSHETGHVVLHPDLVREQQGQTLFAFPFFPEPPTVVYRTQMEPTRMEWQADYFAGCLLVPSIPAIAAFRELAGSRLPYVPTEAEIAAFAARNKGIPRERVVDLYLEQLVAPIAARFQVSRPAMRIRLEEQGCLSRVPQLQLFTFDGDD